MLLEKHAGKVPEDSEAMQNLAGVGRKTANVILNTAFGHPTIAVDTHIFRVSNRTAIAPGKNVLEVERGLLKFVPAEFAYRAGGLVLVEQELVGFLDDMADLAAAGHGAVAGDDLFDERGSGSRHASDEYGRVIGVTGIRE